MQFEYIFKSNKTKPQVIVILRILWDTNYFFFPKKINHYLTIIPHTYVKLDTLSIQLFPGFVNLAFAEGFADFREKEEHAGVWTRSIKTCVY